ncbi:MAG: tetratricopeptide repeat protein [Sphaerochaetaceae bacterium]|nr:tetratricopeptide repeat protein [Sphaerochaetaceae bacterium]
MAKKDKTEISVADKVTENVTGFFNLHKKVILIACAVVVVALIAIVIITSVSSSAKEKAMIRVADLEKRSSAYLSSDEKSADEFNSLVSALNAEIKDSSYTSVKSAYLLGGLYYESGDYANAFAAYSKAYELGKNTYLAPLALVNGAAAAEENGDVDSALSFYTKAAEYKESGVVPKALFNMARIYSSQGKTELAKAELQQIVDSYSSSEYAALAKNILNVM